MRKVKIELDAGISLYLSLNTKWVTRFTSHPTDESLSTVDLISHNLHGEGIWDLSQEYLEYKLTIESLLHHPSYFQSKG